MAIRIICQMKYSLLVIDDHIIMVSKVFFIIEKRDTVKKKLMCV